MQKSLEIFNAEETRGTKISELGKRLRRRRSMACEPRNRVIYGSTGRIDLDGSPGV